MSLTLPNSLRHYQPRACDCEFCTALNVAYLSDARGKLEVFKLFNKVLNRRYLLNADIALMCFLSAMGLKQAQKAQ